MEIPAFLCLLAFIPLSHSNVPVALVERACGYNGGSSMLCNSKALEYLLGDQPIVGVFQATGIFFEYLADVNSGCKNYKKGSFVSIDFCAGHLRLYNCSTLKVTCVHVQEVSTVPPQLPLTANAGTLTGLIMTGLVVLLLFAVLVILLLQKERRERLLPDDSLESELSHVEAAEPPQVDPGVLEDADEVLPPVPAIIVHPPAAEEDTESPPAPLNILPQPPLNALPIVNDQPPPPRYNLRNRNV